MNKKFVSLILTLLLLVNTFYFPAFAAETQDEIRYPQKGEVIYEENFETGDNGAFVSTMSHADLHLSGPYTTPTNAPDYFSATYANGVGTNHSKVGKFYDRGWHNNALSTLKITSLTMYNDDGTENTNYTKDDNRNREGFTTNTAILTGLTHINTKFRYYNTGNVIDSKGNTLGMLTVMYPKENKNYSSTTATFEIHPDKLVLKGRDDGANGNYTETITGAETKKWIDVEFDVVYDDTKNSANLKLTALGQTVNTVIANVSTIDKPAYFYMGTNYQYGGCFYIDDIVITSYQDLPGNFKAAVEEFSFNEVVSGETSNVQDSVYESWPAGLITSFSRAGKTYTVQWKSNKPDVISETGVVNRKSYAQEVILTAKIIESEEVYAERDFKVIVAPVEGAPLDAILSEYSEDVINEATFSKEVTADSNRITNDILPLPTRDDVAGIDIEWTVSPEGIIDPVTGKVTRPSFLADDTVVTLTATISKEGSSVTKDIQYTVVKRTDPTLAIDDAIENLKLTDEDYTKITRDISLPEEFGNVQISWDTSAHSQIDTDGKVTRGDEEVTATITGIFTLDGQTRTKTYTLTVLPTVLKMLEKDVELIDKTGWDELVSNFIVPLVGEKYSSIFKWSSASIYLQVGDNGNITVRRPPNSWTENLSTNLIVTASLDGVETDIPIPVTVLRQEQDSVAVQNAADTINFDLIRGTGNTQDAVVNNLPLPTSFVYDNALKVEWSSSNEAVVKTTGEVIRPLPGQSDVDITLTATVKKNYASATADPIEFTVKALSSVDELLLEAQKSLIFSVISSEEIDNVTENLYLPDTGKYGTTITWTSNSKLIEISGTEGIVTRPEWDDETGGTVVLNAAISYNDGVQEKIVHKAFNITIPENDVFEESEVMLNENFNAWTDEFKFNNATETGIWSAPDTVSSGSKADICLDPTGAENTVIYLTKEDAEAAGYLSYTSSESIDGNSVNVGVKFYVMDDYESTAIVDVFTKGSNISVALARINGASSTIEIDTANNTDTITALYLENATFLKNTWNELNFDINTNTKKFHVYLNGECVTENGYVKYKETGESFVTINGVPYSNRRAVAVDGIRLISNDNTVYLDDLYITKYSLHTEDQKRAAEIWEEAFLSTVNINEIKKDFVLPNLTIDGITIKVVSGQSYILNISGGINVRIATVVDKPTPVTLTPCFDNGKSVYKKTYTCMVYAPDEVDTSLNDEESVAADLKRVVDYLNNNFNLTNLKTNINFENVKALNGSKIIVKSSNPSVIADDGSIFMGAAMQSATLTITAEKGASKKTESVFVTVGVKAQQNNVGGGPAGGGGGGKPAHSGNANVDSETPENTENTENKGNQGSVSAFTDVTKDHWAYDQINYMVENKIMNGVGGGKIEPERTINREEFVKMLVVTLGLDLKEASADFTDVDKDEWYAPYVATIKEKGLINGFEDGSFGIGQNISRQDLAVLIYRSSDLAKEDAGEVFADDAEIADYAKDAVYTLRDLGIINGKDDGKFDPEASATRAETATMLYKAIKAGLFE